MIFPPTLKTTVVLQTFDPDLNPEIPFIVFTNNNF